MRTCVLLFALAFAGNLYAADMSVPKETIAGTPLAVTTSGSGDADLLVVGPGRIATMKVRLGNAVEIAGDNLPDAGRYLLILRSGKGEVSKSLIVSPGKPAHLSFVAHPSRAPVAQQNGITGAVYPFDAYNNLITAPLDVQFKLSGPQVGAVSHSATTENGVASVTLNSPSHEGPVSFEASAQGVTAIRAVRVVADEPCTLHIRAEPLQQGIRVQTEPVKDCSGNLVPDGTLVTFTEWDQRGRSTVDASVKKGIAQANLPAKGEVRVSAAAGVALGNEVRLRVNP